MFSGISRTATHFAIKVKKNITGNKLYVLKLPCEKKISFKLISKSLEISCKFQVWLNLIYKPDQACKKRACKTSVQNPSVCAIQKQQLLFAFYYLTRAGGLHFQSIFTETFLS